MYWNFKIYNLWHIPDCLRKTLTFTNWVSLGGAWVISPPNILRKVSPWRFGTTTTVTSWSTTIFQKASERVTSSSKLTKIIPANPATMHWPQKSQISCKLLSGFNWTHQKCSSLHNPSAAAAWPNNLVSGFFTSCTHDLLALQGISKHFPSWVRYIRAVWIKCSAPLKTDFLDSLYARNFIESIYTRILMSAWRWRWRWVVCHMPAPTFMLLSLHICQS